MEFPNPYFTPRKDSVGEASNRLANALAPALVQAGGPDIDAEALGKVLTAIFHWIGRKDAPGPETMVAPSDLNSDTNSG